VRCEVMDGLGYFWVGRFLDGFGNNKRHVPT
jgi:hypothetical protein